MTLGTFFNHSRDSIMAVFRLLGVVVTAMKKAAQTKAGFTTIFGIPLLGVLGAAWHTVQANAIGFIHGAVVPWMSPTGMAGFDQWMLGVNRFVDLGVLLADFLVILAAESVMLTYSFLKSWIR